MYAFHDGGGIPVVHPEAADGVFGLLWLIIALPLAGAAILLIGGKYTDKWGHLLGTLLPIGSFVLSVVMFSSLLGRADDDRQVDDVRTGKHLAESEQLGELAVVQPAPFVDDHAPRPGQNPAETEQPHLEKAYEQRAARHALESRCRRCNYRFRRGVRAGLRTGETEARNLAPLGEAR